jgi:hypothetical protein
VLSLKNWCLLNYGNYIILFGAKWKWAFRIAIFKNGVNNWTIFEKWSLKIKIDLKMINKIKSRLF